MWTYLAPLTDMRFVMERVLNAQASWQQCQAFESVDADTTFAALAEAAKFASEVLAPTNARGDIEGCTLTQHEVRTPKGYRETYQAFVDGGWPALPCDPAWGGHGLPLLVDAAMREMLTACNHAWTMYPDLLHGAYETIKTHGSDELKSRYLSKIVSGEWLAAMALTEPQAGSDLGLLRTSAELMPDGSLRVSGNKIFISGGEHDLTDNIVHLVLCRLPDAPPGTKGISLALVPKLLPDGSRNTFYCDGIEKKMGIKGSATCAMRYERATGWLVGERDRGLAAMFVMMNSARLHVGLQGLGHQEMATQNALRYAQERLQMRANLKPEGAAQSQADPIAWHPAMRRTLLRLQALTEGQRVIAYRTAQLLDEATHHADATQRVKASQLAAQLTPIVKAFMTHHGFHSASAAQQVFGGYGYVHDYGIEQTVRDSRIAMIYEGTNEIQAIDLLVRKVLGREGDAALSALLSDMAQELAHGAAHEALHDFHAALKEQIAQVRAASQALRDEAAAHPERALHVADDYLMGLSYMLMTWAWAASARAALACEDKSFATRKLEVMRYGIEWVLPEAAPNWQRIHNTQATLPWVKASL
jgi:alkylation response protein AidB-like acyl-CoA dehydrogenase